MRLFLCLCVCLFSRCPYLFTYFHSLANHFTCSLKLLILQLTKHNSRRPSEGFCWCFTAPGVCFSVFFYYFNRVSVLLFYCNSHSIWASFIGFLEAFLFSWRLEFLFTCQRFFLPSLTLFTHSLTSPDRSVQRTPIPTGVAPDFSRQFYHSHSDWWVMPKTYNIHLRQIAGILGSNVRTKPREAKLTATARTLSCSLFFFFYINLPSTFAIFAEPILLNFCAANIHTNPNPLGGVRALPATPPLF